MSLLVLGYDTPSFPGDTSESTIPAGSVYAGVVGAYSTRSVDTLTFKTGPSANTGVTSVWLGLYAYHYDSMTGTEYPGALLGSVEIAGAPAPNTVLSGTITPVAVTSGTFYYLSVLPLGGALHGIDYGSGGYQYAVQAGLSGLEATWDPSGDSTASGAMYVGAGLDSTYVPPPPDPTAVPVGLTFQVTGVIPFGETVPAFYGQIADPSAGEVVVPLNDSRTASVTFSTLDPVAATLAAAEASGDLRQVPYETHLKVFYYGVLVFWGPVKVRSVDMVAGTVRLDAVDMTLRLISHFVREGDFATSSDPLVIEVPAGAGATTGQLPVSDEGLRQLRDAANTLSFPPLGIDDGDNTYTGSVVNAISVARGDGVYPTWQSIQQSTGPEWALTPRDLRDGFYCQLDTFDRQGSDISSSVQMHFAVGRHNLDGLSYVEGEQYVNLVHVFDRDLKYKAISTNATSLARTGPYIQWDATDYPTDHLDETAAEATLKTFGDDIIDSYSRPLVALSLTLPIDSDDGFRYPRDFGVGDTIGVAGKAGFVELPEAPYRIGRWSATLEGDGVRQAIEVVSGRLSGDESGDGTDPT